MDSDIRPRKRLAERPETIVTQTNTTGSVPAETQNFQTPEQVADSDAQTTFEQMSKPVKQPFLKRLISKWPRGKKGWAAGLLALCLIGFSGGFIYAKHAPKPVASADTKVATKKPVKPEPLYATLSGLPITDASLNQKPVTGVMVENSPDARPQSGLSQASVVFEAIAEGGITRFLALYQDTAPDNVGPIRSARPYYVQWALGFNAGYAHVGGSPEALQDIKQWNVRDLDQFYNSASYHRISTRVAPHNVYTGIPTLQQLEAGKGYTSSTYKGFSRKADAASKTPNAKSINFHLSGPTYDVHYDYNPASNSYNRSEGGAPHIDANTNAQLSPKIVVGLVMPYSLMSDGYHSQYNTIGTGQAYIFQDGTVTIGSWKKASQTDNFTFSDSKGKPVPFNRGQTWLTALSASANVTYTP